MSSNYIKNVAIVGASGNSGSYMTKSLLETGRHTVTAITREGGSSKFPDGVKVVKVDYENPSTIVEALRGQDAFIITMSVFAPQDTQAKLIEAAAEANVPWILPNAWGNDVTNEGIVRDIVGYGALGEARKLIDKLGKSSHMSVITGFWYEWSLAMPMAEGIDCVKHEATLFDDGNTKITTSTWPQVGRAVAALLILPIQPEGGDKDHCLERFKNDFVYVGSFTVSQNDMLESAFRVTNTKREDWKITQEPSHERYAKAVADMKAGDRMAFVRHLYTRMMYPDDSGNHEKKRGLVNDLLGLPKENIDEATKAAIWRQENVTWP